jgi:hypothetical protein
MSKVITEKMVNLSKMIKEVITDCLSEPLDDIDSSMAVLKCEVELLRKIKEFVSAKVNYETESGGDMTSVSFTGAELDMLIDLLTAYDAL